MQYSLAAVLALAASVSAWGNESVVYTTEVHTAYTTYCPLSTTLSFNGVTYTVSEATTLTITNCPCTVIKPVTTTSSVSCSTSAAVPTTAPVYTNATTPAGTTPAKTSSAGSVGTTSAKVSSTPSTVAASDANKAMALSGASLAGLLGLAAYIL